MQSLQEKASAWSGVDAADAFAIDETNLVYDDEEEWFRSIFANSKKEEAIQNQYEFFVQRMGGPPLYSQRRGHPALIGRHRPFPVTHQAAERWLHHMEKALESTPDIDADSKVKMMNFFRHTAYFLVAGDELKNKKQEPSCKCKHGGCKSAAP
ncbi:Two-on-two hemoglobin-3 [Hibiscus syriacus]|uniref:Two-on-two hemoglobin-3 n=1 Tax=Hibiscus syriacus TaxID=106335 RepID=A0A6A3B5Y7_HIBSY|nr:Two-on-two hemoglobin-3 [Hibiscus syriacus]